MRPPDVMTVERRAYRDHAFAAANDRSLFCRHLHNQSVAHMHNRRRDGKPERAQIGRQLGLLLLDAQQLGGAVGGRHTSARRQRQINPPFSG
jgi:hypothetical protein